MEMNWGGGSDVKLMVGFWGVPRVFSQGICVTAGEARVGAPTVQIRLAGDLSD